MPLGQTDHTGKHAYRWTITCSQRCFNAGTPPTTLAQHLVSVAVLGLLLMTGALPSKHKTLNPCCFIVAPTSETAGQHSNNCIIVGHVSYTVLAGRRLYCCASEAGQSTEGQSVLLRSRVTSPQTWLTLIHYTVADRN